MSTIADLAVTGLILGLLSSAMGILIVCIGPKALKDYMIEWYNTISRILLSMIIMYCIEKVYNF